MKRIILITMMILISLIYNSENLRGGDLCTGSKTCTQYDIDCNSVKDGFCPEIYGDWSSCDIQSYGKCIPCDPDCGTCGDIELIAPKTVKPCEQIEFIVTAALSKTPDTIAVSRGSNVNDPTFRNSRCDTGETLCIRKFTTDNKDGFLCDPGTSYCLTATTEKLKQDNVYVTKCIQVVPEVIITDYGTSGISPIIFNVKSSQGVTKGEIYLYKKDPKTNEFKPVKVNNINSPDYCSFKCDLEKEPNCNLLNSESVPDFRNSKEFIFNWNTKKCDNKEFKIVAFGHDFPDNFNSDSKTLTLANQNPPCIDQCYIFNSQLLNTVYLKIKSWII